MRSSFCCRIYIAAWENRAQRSFFLAPALLHSTPIESQCKLEFILLFVVHGVCCFFHFRVFVPLIGRCWFRRVRHENWKHCTAFSIKPKINNITTRTIHCNTNCAAVVFYHRFFVIHVHCRNIYLYHIERENFEHHLTIIDYF